MNKNFTMIPNEVDDDGLSVYAARLYWVLMRYTNLDRDNCYKAYPNQKQLKEKSKMSKSKVTDAVNELIKTGWIKDIEKGKNFNNIYFLNVKKEINHELIKRREREALRNRKKTLQANAKKQIRNVEKGIPAKNGSLPHKPPKKYPDGGLLKTPGAAYEKSHNNINLTKLKESPVPKETERNSSDYPETKPLLDLIIKEGLINTAPPESNKELKRYKQWQAQLKQLLKLGTKKEIFKAIKRGIFYDNFKVSTPAGISKSLQTEILKIRKEKADRDYATEHFLDGCVTPEELKKKEEKEIPYAPMPDYVKKRFGRYDLDSGQSALGETKNKSELKIRVDERINNLIQTKKDKLKEIFKLSGAELKNMLGENLSNRVWGNNNILQNVIVEKALSLIKYQYKLIKTEEKLKQLDSQGTTNSENAELFITKLDIKDIIEFDLVQIDKLLINELDKEINQLVGELLKKREGLELNDILS